MNFEQILTNLAGIGISLGGKLIAALLVLVIGLKLSSFIVKLVVKTKVFSKIDITAQTFLKSVLNIMYNVDEINLYEKVFYEGYIRNTKVILVKSNVGKVNAARVTQVLIDNFNVKMVINVGTAGSLDNKLDIGDIVVASTLVQYDFDVTPFGRKLGEIENIGEYIEVDKNLLEIFNKFNVTIGCIATGDKFVVDNEEKKRIKDYFNALCIEMEGASIAQVCYLCKLPFLVIRSITDKLDGSSKIDFSQLYGFKFSFKRLSEVATNVLAVITLLLAAKVKLPSLSNFAAEAKVGPNPSTLLLTCK
jgi:adenosylhomocysteine nucleosidase